MSLNYGEIKSRWNRCLDKLTWGRPFKQKLAIAPIPHFCPPAGPERLRRGIAAFDGDHHWSFILETPFGCFRISTADKEILIDQIKFTLQTLDPRYRLDCTKLKLHIFDAKGQIFAIQDINIGVIGRSYSLILIYTLKA